MGYRREQYQALHGEKALFRGLHSRGIETPLLETDGEWLYRSRTVAGEAHFRPFIAS